jgi:prepilin-type N-terminal cleavage/methylation domain-containing protein
MRLRSRNAERGFSLLEVIVVMAVGLVITGIAVIGYQNIMQNFTINASMDAVVGQLRVARQTAISRRREVQVWFDTTTPAPDFVQHVNTQVQARPGELPFPIDPAQLSRTSQFYVFPALADTPMAFGNLSAIYIGGVSGGPPIMKFTTTGAFVDGANNPLNGTIFLGIPGATASARAVTIMGATGRIRPYYWTGTQWQE